MLVSAMRDALVAPARYSVHAAEVSAVRQRHGARTVSASKAFACPAIFVAIEQFKGTAEMKNQTAYGDAV